MERANFVKITKDQTLETERAFMISVTIFKKSTT